jgi:hypothetical protein
VIEQLTCSFLQAVNALFEVRYVAFQTLHMLGVETFVSSLIQGNLAHELPEVVEAVLDTLEALVGLPQTRIGLIQTRVGLIQTRVGLIQSRVEILPQLLDAVANFPEDFDSKIGSHNAQVIP